MDTVIKGLENFHQGRLIRFTKMQDDQKLVEALNSTKILGWQDRFIVCWLQFIGCFSKYGYVHSIAVIFAREVSRRITTTSPPAIKASPTVPSSSAPSSKKVETTYSKTASTTVQSLSKVHTETNDELAFIKFDLPPPTEEDIRVRNELDAMAKARREQDSGVRLIKTLGGLPQRDSPGTGELVVPPHSSIKFGAEFGSRALFHEVPNFRSLVQTLKYEMKNNPHLTLSSYVCFNGETAKIKDIPVLKAAFEKAERHLNHGDSDVDKAPPTPPAVHAPAAARTPSPSSPALKQKKQEEPQVAVKERDTVLHIPKQRTSYQSNYGPNAKPDGGMFGWLKGYIAT